ncbi:MAG TPA: heat-inducible transcription repressor HrcA, partial [Thermoanaerobaculia bacterium]|nr:heat-inducible transcription repressor HrcA [Thermoanaerobaculia bacterium]
MAQRHEQLDPDLDPRAREVLREIIAQYIGSGEPIGSRTLAKCGKFQLSPASLRNVMADLEDLGFLAQPHTSAGRIPTDRGYRFYADALLASTPASSDEAPEEVELTRMRREVEDAMRETTHALSQVTDLLAVATAPPPSAARIHRVEVLQ